MRNDNFDPMDLLYEQMLREAYTRDTEELKEWLADNHFYSRSLNEASGGQAALKWKDSILAALNTLVQSTSTWITNQLPGDTDFLNANQAILLDPNRYPPRIPQNMNGAPNYARALQRISSPLIAALKGYDIGKIEDDVKANLAFKKAIIPTYDGKTDFTQYAKMYYYGGLPTERVNVNQQQFASMLKMGYQFCTSLKTRFNTAKQDADQIIQFINANSTGSISNQLKMDQQKLQQMQNTAANNRAAGMASTNPGANAGTMRPVNADTSYEYFMEEYFSEAMPGTTAPTTNNIPKPAVTAPTSTTTPLKSTPTNNPTASTTANQMAASKQPNGAPVDPNALAARKKQIMAEIIRGVLAAKMAAMTMIYRDFMMMMKIHVASYGGNTGQQPQQQQATQAAPIQQQQQQPVVQQPQQ